MLAGSEGVDLREQRTRPLPQDGTSHRLLGNNTHGHPQIGHGAEAQRRSLFQPFTAELENLVHLTKLPDLNVLTCKNSRKHGLPGLQSPAVAWGCHGVQRGSGCCPAVLMGERTGLVTLSPGWGPGGRWLLRG